MSAIYETGQAIVAAGVIIGFDMTPEAALTKLSYVLGRDDWSIEKKREMMQTSLKGELDSHDPQQRPKHPNNRTAVEDNGDTGKNLLENVAHTVANTFDIAYSSAEQRASLERVVGPPVQCALMTYFMENERDKVYLEKLFEDSEAVISLGDYTGRTALHVAAALGDAKVVEFLLKKGASVHLRDRLVNTKIGSKLH